MTTQYLLYSACSVSIALASTAVSNAASPTAAADAAMRRTIASGARQSLKRFGLQIQRRPDAKKKTTDVIHNPIPFELIEKILRELKYDFTKNVAGTWPVYTFRNKDNFQIRLTPLFDRKNLMLSATFPYTSLSRLNQYNTGRFFVRAVQYSGNNNMQETVFESNLNCGKGATETMVRYFINRYDLDIRRFADKLFNGRQN